METQESKELNGAFYSSLKRNNKQIRDDRAQSISEDAQMIFKRKIEDLRTMIKRMNRELNDMLDMSGTTTTNIINASDFNAVEFVDADLKLGLKIREYEITLEIAEKRYAYLFGEECK